MQDATQIRPEPAGRKITLDDARSRTRLFREGYRDKVPTMPEHVIANTFSKELLLEMLKQPGCEGIRMYHAVRPDAGSGSEGRIRELVLVGVDKEGNDLLTVSEDPGSGKRGCSPLGIFLALPASPPPSTPGIIAGSPRPCPTLCGTKPSPLTN